MVSSRTQADDGLLALSFATRTAGEWLDEMGQFRNAMSSETFGDRKCYLKPEAILEPLVCGWHAWSHLLSPAQHAHNIAFRHIVLMESFLKNPGVHVANANNPVFYGGPFVQLAADQVTEVKALLQETRTRCEKLVVFANEFRKLDLRLQGAARGHSMNEFYEELAAPLSGLVEFIYDINSHPKIRILEELLYEEKLSRETQEIFLALDEGAERPFFMSTPRLESSTSLKIKVPFSDPRLDFLSRMRVAPELFSSVVQQFAVPESDTARWSNFFTEIPVTSRAKCDYKGDGVRIRYFGHACVLIQTEKISILIDPLLPWGASKDDGRFTFYDLPEQIDYVILSHGHQDHCNAETLLQLRHRIKRVIVPNNNKGSITDPSMMLALREIGFDTVITVNAFDRIVVPDGVLTSLPFAGEHVDLDIYSRHGIYVELLGRKFVFFVDSDGRDRQLYRRIAQKCGRKLDAIFLGMECHGAPLTWLYGPLLTKPISRRDDESRRLSGLDSERAWTVLEEFDASRVFIYAMGQEPWLQYIMGLRYSTDSVQLVEMRTLLDRCEQAGMVAENLYISKEMAF
jgi:L-ascorbate metabolism protein UlaG (beta-lactamase superfamily)